MKIKYIGSIITAITMLYTSSAIALEKDSDLAICSSMEKIAHIVMTARQVGISESDLAKTADDNFTGAQHKAADNMIKIAYLSPIEDSKSDKKEAISKFKTIIFNGCIKARGTEQ